MSRLSAFLLGFIAGAIVLSSLLLGHANNWVNEGPPLGVIFGVLGSIIVVIVTSILDYDDN